MRLSKVQKHWLTALELFENPEELAKVKEDHTWHVEHQKRINYFTLKGLFKLFILWNLENQQIFIKII